ncbi:threonine/serine exporter family protein [Enterococcus plantarum]|uniref:Threonine/serine exporter n=1 Tax=Enterococcus plantarum TaxID=1077675 RepID=A0A2W3Z9V3_9ENTE|nr:threonine/serine exporter family protein [Enterococcus plantarum]MBO0422965.1 threonine/serine exporter family protein [Enterococcus plantarum]MBO0468293.1 threonine/serine exporter family protein [Enterococcus plantarum]PZL76628.1 threonine/serine exporter [Enterococcus plantarum]
MEVVIHCLFSYLSTVTFGIVTNVPRKVLNTCGITGAVGWMIYWSTKNLDAGVIFANFLGAIGIGLLSIYFSRRKKMPMTIFNIPSLVPLVPGGPAYQAVRSIVLGDYVSGVHFIIKVIMTAGAIAAGFMVTGIIERLLKNSLDKKRSFK